MYHGAFSTYQASIFVTRLVEVLASMDGRAGRVLYEQIKKRSSHKRESKWQGLDNFV